MKVSNPGGQVELQFEVSLERARRILRASGKMLGVCYRPFASDEPRPVLTHLLWLEVPPETRVPLHEAWRKPDAHKEASNHLAEVYGGDSAGRLGVCTWGGPPGPGV